MRFLACALWVVSLSGCGTDALDAGVCVDSSPSAFVVEDGTWCGRGDSAGCADGTFTAVESKADSLNAMDDTEYIAACAAAGYTVECNSDESILTAMVADEADCSPE